MPRKPAQIAATVYRHSLPSTPGYFVQYESRDEGLLFRFFSDHRHGGSDGAATALNEWLNKERHKPRMQTSGPGTKIKSASGITGVLLVIRRQTPSWAVDWNNQGKSGRRYFSIKKLGYSTAFYDAVRFLIETSGADLDIDEVPLPPVPPGKTDALRGMPELPDLGANAEALLSGRWSPSP